LDVFEDVVEDPMVLHKLLIEGGLVHPMLTMSNFQPNRRDSRGWTVLHAACHKDEGILAPIDAGSLLASPEARASTPSLLDYMLSRQADPYAMDNQGRNMLHHLFLGQHAPKSSRCSNIAIARIARDFPQLVNQADASGKTPFYMALRHAVFRWDTAPAQALLDNGASALTSDHNGNTPLHVLGCRFDHSTPHRALFMDLLRRGLDINSRNSKQETPAFNLVTTLPEIAAVSTYARVPPGKGVITPAEALALFKDAGADLYAVDSRGRGLLHAVAGGSLERSEIWFRALLDLGLDPMMEDGSKRTALDVATACGKEKVMRFFEKDGA
jgi:ankyrin repeat protein